MNLNSRPQGIPANEDIGAKYLSTQGNKAP